MILLLVLSQHDEQEEERNRTNGTQNKGVHDGARHGFGHSPRLSQ
jgi:hypothetical protein